MELSRTTPFIPLSLEELNAYLEKCNQPSDISFQAMEDYQKKPICLTHFFSALGPRVQSYSDLTPLHLLSFVRSLQRLFPKENYSELDRKALALFWANIKEIQKQDTPLQPLAPLYTATLRNEDEKEVVNLSAEEILVRSREILNQSPEERLEETLSIYSAIPKDIFEKAKRLQDILALLYIEDELFRQLAIDTHLVLDLQRVQSDYRQGCQQIIRTSSFSEATLFDLPEEIDDSEEFAFWLQLCFHLEVYDKEKKLQVMFKPVSKSDVRSFHSIVKKARYLEANSKSTKTKFLAQKTLLYWETEKASSKFKRLCNKTISLIKRIQEWANNDDRYLPEQLVTPLSYFILSLVNQELNKALRNPRDLTITNYQDRQKAIDVWVSKRENQRQFFDFVLSALDKVILEKSNPCHQKKILLAYRKNAFEKHGVFSTKVFDIPLSLPNLQETLATLPPKCASDQKSFLPQTPLKPRKAEVFFTKKKKLQSQNKSQNRALFTDQLNSPDDPLAADRKSTEMNRRKTQEEEKEDPSEKRALQIPNRQPHSVPSLFQKGLMSPFPYDYHPRVERWHQHPISEPLSPTDFPEYVENPLEYQQRMHLFHALSPAVDQFFEAWAIKSRRKNKTTGEQDSWDIIPAEIAFKEKVYRGIIAFATNKRKICYHKCFTEHIESEVIANIIQGRFDKFDFPDLRISQEILSKQKKSKRLLKSEEAITIDSILGTAEIINSNQGYKIKLFSTS